MIPLRVVERAEIERLPEVDDAVVRWVCPVCSDAFCEGQLYALVSGPSAPDGTPVWAAVCLDCVAEAAS